MTACRVSRYRRNGGTGCVQRGLQSQESICSMLPHGSCEGVVGKATGVAADASLGVVTSSSGLWIAMIPIFTCGVEAADSGSGKSSAPSIGKRNLTVLRCCDPGVSLDPGSGRTVVASDLELSIVLLCMRSSSGIISSGAAIGFLAVGDLLTASAKLLMIPSVHISKLADSDDDDSGMALGTR